METETLIVKYINILSEHMRQSMRKRQEETNCTTLFNLSITQLHYLHAIKEMEGLTFKQLAEKFNVQKPTVTAIINRLIKQDIVFKKQSKNDLRVFHIFLTAKGHELLDIENLGYFDFAKSMTKCLDDNQKEHFAEFLKIIINNIE